MTRWWSGLAAATCLLACAGCPGGVDEDGDGVTVGGGDCDDRDEHSYPGADELCDGRDNDCDGVVPDGEHDGDVDGFMVCIGDCDDADPAVFPGAEELCNGVDDDCDGSLAEEEDGDGDGYAACEGDCDDGDPYVSPEAADECGGPDADCDGDPDTHHGGPCITCDRRVSGGGDALQEAGDAALDGETVCVEPASYPVVGVEYGGRQLHIVGIGGPRFTTVDAEQSGTVFVFDDGEGAGSILEGLTITGGYAQRGGGIRVQGASPTLRNLVITGNAVYQEESSSGIGGGIYLVDSSPVLDRILVSGNLAEEDGGGIYIDVSDPTLEDVTVSANAAHQYGGGVFSVDSGGAWDRVELLDNRAELAGGGMWMGTRSPSLSQLTVSGNTTDGCEECFGGGIGLAWADADFDGLNVTRNGGGRGGGVYVSGNATFHDASVTHNDAVLEGGGFHIDDGEVELSSVRVAGNVAEAGGGFRLGNATVTLDGGIVAGNSAMSSGGGVFLVNASLALDGVAVVANVAAADGGGIHQAGTPFTAENVSISDNEAARGGGVYLASGGDPEIRYCNLWENAGGDTANFAAEPVGQSGNLSQAPGFLDVVTDDPDLWDLHLSADSPLVDAGNPTRLDPDGSPSDVGAYGGDGAGAWDLDRDGFFEWWQPGPYDSEAYPGLGWDCDDRDATVHPGSGC